MCDLSHGFVQAACRKRQKYHRNYDVKGKRHRRTAIDDKTDTARESTARARVFVFPFFFDCAITACPQ